MNNRRYYLQKEVYRDIILKRELRVGDQPRAITCIVCKKDFLIPPWDYRYKELKFKRNKPCVCERCNFSLQKEAMIVSGLSPEDLERLDRCDRIIR